MKISNFHQNPEGQEKSFSSFNEDYFFFKFSFSTLAKTVGSVPFKYFFVHSFFKGFKSGFENHASYQLNVLEIRIS